MIIPRTSHGLAHALFHNKRTIFGVFFATVGGALAYVLLATPIYQATASLAVDFGENARVAIRDQEVAGVLPAETRRATVANYERVLTSRDLLAEVINEVGIERLFPDLDIDDVLEEARTAALAGDAAAAPAASGLAFWASAVPTDGEATADAGADAAPAAAAAMIAEPGRESAAEAEGAAESLSPEERLIAKAVRLFRDDFLIDRPFDNTILELSYFHRDPDVAIETLGLIIDKFIARRAEIFENPHLRFIDAQLDASAEALEAAQEDLFAFRRESGIFMAEQQLQRMVDQRESIQTEIDALTYEIDAIDRGQSNGGVGTRASAGRTAAEVRIAFLRGQIERADARIAEHVSAELRLAQLQQEVDSKIRTYEAVLDRYEEARFADRVQADSISPVTVLDQPKTGDRPARPRKMLLMFAALVFGGLAGLGAGLAAELMRTRFTTPEQVMAELKLPPLAVIDAGAPNLLSTLRPANRRAARRAAEAADAPSADAAGVGALRTEEIPA